MWFHILAVSICWVNLVNIYSHSWTCWIDTCIRYLDKQHTSCSFIDHAHLSYMQNARPPLPPTCPAAFSHLINHCWSTNPDKRPHFNEIVSTLESHLTSVEEDPEFLSNFVPSSPDHTVIRCLPNCIVWNRSAHLKPLSSS